eukprot:TRINITY_DN1085_c0_g2_i2.p1 TRINITY_DN1085_c0_g2~~TRINITY_DN1085_c0_g2_i2.p1  ORF type:complete len:395 (+),score=125.37 TRINITY_DN1085_c0_g2_i2:75-1259(+)
MPSVSGSSAVIAFLGVALLVSAFIFLKNDPQSESMELLRHQNSLLLQELEKTKLAIKEAVDRVQAAQGASQPQSGVCPAPTCPPAPPAAPPPPPPPPSSNDEMTTELVECLRRPAKSRQPLEHCWNEARRAQWLTVMERLKNHPGGPGQMDASDWWQAFAVVVPTYECEHNHFRRIGSPTTLYPNGTHMDGGKWLCGPLLFTPDEKCVIYSLGSYGEFSFEEGMEADSDGACEIHSFDCSGSWEHPATKFHPWCIGPKDEVGQMGQFYKLSTIAEKLGHKHITLLKVDIEGAEWEMLSSFPELPKEFLPRQIMVEFHIGGGTFNRFYDLLLKLDKLGYRVASKEVNAWCHSCSEFLFVRADEYDQANTHDIKYLAKTGVKPKQHGPGVSRRTPA